MTKYDKLKSEIDKLNKEIDEQEEKCAREGKSFDSMLSETTDLRLKVVKKDQELRLIKDPSIQFGKEWNGDYLTIEQFIHGCKNNHYTDEMGYGRYATDNGVSDIQVYPSDILDDKYRKDFSHVVWFEYEKPDEII